MRTQFDMQKRIVSLENLKAMCEHISGMAHKYEVSKVSRSRVHVTYSNPDEYGNPRPIVAVFAAIPSAEVENPGIVLDLLRCIGDQDGYDYQAFDQLLYCPTLYRFIGPGWQPNMWEWKTRQQINGTDRYLCPDGITRTVDYSHPYTNSTFAAFDVTADTPAEYFERRGGNRHFAYFSWSDLSPAKQTGLEK